VTVGWKEEVSLLYTKDIKISEQAKCPSTFAHKRQINLLQHQYAPDNRTEDWAVCSTETSEHTVTKRCTNLQETTS